MKKYKKKLIIVNIAILLSALGVAFVAFPFVSKAFYQFVSKQSEKFFAEVKNSTGLVISYEQLSPSLFARVYLKNVQISDDKENKIAFFEKVLVEYKLINVITGHFDDAIQRIGIRDGSIAYNEKNQSSFFEKLLSKNKDDTAKNEQSAETQKNDFRLPIKNFTVILQNILFTADTVDISSELTIYLGKFIEKDGKLRYTVQSHVALSPKHNQNLKLITSDIKLEGNSVRDFSSFSSVLSIHNFTADAFKLVNTSFFLSYNENIVSVLALQQNKSLDIKASYNLKTKQGNAATSFENIKPSKLIQAQNEYFKSIEPLSFTGSISAEFNLNKGAREKIKYVVDISAQAPKITFKDFSTRKLTFKLAAEGTEKFVSLKKLSLDSTTANMAANGFYNIANGSVRANAALNRLTIQGAVIKASAALSGSAKKYNCTLSDVYIGEAYFATAALSMTPRGNEWSVAASIDDTIGNYEFDAVYTQNANEKKFLEAHGVLNSISVQNIYKAVAALSPNSASGFLKTQLEPFRITSEFYATSDFQSFSYNVVQLIAASTEAGGMYLLSSFDGNTESFNLQSFNLNIGQQQITGNVAANFAGGDVFFNALFSVDAISYSLNGILANRMITVYGDYGLSLTTFFEGETLKGNFTMKEFPIPAAPFVLSVNANFDYVDKTNWNVFCDEASLIYSTDAIIDSYTQVPFQLAFKGQANPKNVFLSNIEMGNNVSMLKGQASFDSISNNYDFIKQFSVIVKLENDIKTSSLDLNCNFSIAKEVFVDGSLSVHNVSFATFSSKQALTDMVNGDVTFLGSLDNLLLQAHLKNLTMHVKNKPLEASCMFLIDDGTIRIPEAHINWAGHDISSVNVNFRPENGTGNLALKYTGMLSDKSTNAEIGIDVAGKTVSPLDKKSSIEKMQAVVESFVMDITIKNASIGDQKQDKPFLFTIMRENGVIALYDSENKITGFYLDDGTVSLNMSRDFKTHISLDGAITKNKINVQFYDLNVDIPQVLSLINIGDYVAFTTGALTGSLLIDGKMNEPQFFGTLYLSEINFNSPRYAPDNLYAPSVPIIFSGYSIKIPFIEFAAKTFKLWAEAHSEFDGWIPYDTFVHCGVDEKKPGHMKTNNLLFHADGKAFCDLTINITPEATDLQGTAKFDNGSFSIAFDTFDEFTELFSGGSYNFTMDLALSLGNKAEFNWPSMRTPILRTLTPTTDPIVFHVTPDTFTMTGLAKLRGGEITYIKRNFYIKEGNIKFVETLDGFSPLLTLRAEIRDKDLEGKPVKLILNMKDQSLTSGFDDWISKITADPAKSEAEVLQLLGQLVTGDMTKSTIVKDTLTNATDLVTQMTFAKNIENTVRDFLHLDVLSLRTQVVQNLIFGNIFKNPEQDTLKLGDYLDNTSLYFGKYFGSAIYADAGLHLSNYDPLKDLFADTRKPVYKSILFQPELGLEMTTPFFNVRWAISPINVNSLFVDNTSLTFSWNFSY